MRCRENHRLPIAKKFERSPMWVGIRCRLVEQLIHDLHQPELEEVNQSF
uniref:Uncharacterized protein n=1 Tax=Arundo donax TaxID=35708 RepID=A0A0A9R159_ARUDO